MLESRRSDFNFCFSRRQRATMNIKERVSADEQRDRRKHEGLDIEDEEM